MAFDGRERRSFRTTYIAAGRSLALVLGTGAACGFLIGGVGGRLAMLILRLTSDRALVGQPTDDGFVIGAITTESTFLLLAGTLVGLFLAPLYIVVRDWLPLRGRPALYGLWNGAIGGGAILHPDGVDFVVVEPRWLAVALFIALPMALGRVTATLLERALRTRRPPSILPMLPLTTLPSGIFVVPMLLVCALFLALDRDRRIDRIWRRPVITWLGRIALAGGLAIGVMELARDIPAIL